MTTRCYIDFAAGDIAIYTAEVEAYEALAGWLTKNGANYGLPAELDELDEVARETLAAVYEGDTKITLTPASFSRPPPLTLPRLHLTLSSSSGLTKTVTNFVTLLTDSKSLVSKRAPHPPLRYVGNKVFRIDQGFVVQTGDVTRQDGSGGESIYGGTFNDEKEGLRTPFELGTIAMANSGKNSNTSQVRFALLSSFSTKTALIPTSIPQFFLTLTSDPVKLKKLMGKYVAFGQADVDDRTSSSRACLEALDQLGDGKGGTKEPVWIEACGLL